MADETMTTVPKAGWRIREWHMAVGMSRTKTCNLIRANILPSVKSGASRIITISPEDYLAALLHKPTSSGPHKSPD